MKRRISMIAVSVLCLSFAFFVCGCSSNADSSHSKSQSGSNQSAKSKSSTGSDNTHSSSNNSNDNQSKQKSNNSEKSSTSGGTKSNPSSNQSNQQLAVARTNAVIQATLKVESSKPDTTVDYQSKTMTQSGKKVRFSIIPDANHQKDLKSGLISEIMDKTHNVTLYAYKFENHQLSLIDTGTSKVVYTVPFNNSSK